MPGSEREIGITYWIENRLTSLSTMFHSYRDITIADERLQHFGLCSALIAFEQRGIFIVSYLLW